ETTCASEMLARWGNIGWVSSDGPILPRSQAPTSSTQKIACGLPMLRAEGACRVGSSVGRVPRSIARVSSNFLASGISFQAKRGLPISTVEIDGRSPFQQLSNPAVVSKVKALFSVSLNSNSATQRMPLPQAPASEPSLL